MRLVQIMLVEDSPEDVLLTRETFKDAKVANEMHVVGDGEQAMAFLRREGPHSNAPRPDLILLDLNLPRMDGRQLLSEVKSDESLRMIPIVVLTTSVSDRDVLHAYDNMVNAYVRKPVDLERFIEVVSLIDRFWIGVVTFPPAEN